MEVEKIRIVSSHGLNMKLLVKDGLASKKIWLTYLHQKSKVRLFTPNKEGRFKCAITWINEDPFTLKTLE